MREKILQHCNKEILDDLSPLQSWLISLWFMYYFNTVLNHSIWDTNHPNTYTMLFEHFNYLQKLNPQTSVDIINLIVECILDNNDDWIDKIISDYQIQFKAFN